MLNNNFLLKDKGVSNALGTGSLARHRWYFVKEGFSPELVDKAIETEGVESADLVFDPFSGSGTVALASATKNIGVQAFEVNPFLRFLSATKLRQGSSKTLLEHSRSVLLRMERPTKSPLEGFSTFSEGNRWGRWLFPRGVLRAFQSGLEAADEVRQPHQDFIKLALLGAAMDCCNATRDGKCLRYPKGWQDSQATAAEFRGAFWARIEILAEDLDQAPLRCTQAAVRLGDSRQLLKEPSNEKFRLCVTSPPYLNSFDYSDVYRPELFLGRFVDSNDALMNVRLSTVRSHVQASWAAPTKNDFGGLYSRCMEEIRDVSQELWDERLPAMVQAYFEDMDGMLADMRKRARKNASIWLVVSTSAYGGVEIPVDLILAESARKNGWFLREVGVLRHLRSSSQHVKHVSEPTRKSIPLRESVVILDACP